MNGKVVIAGGTGFIGEYLRERFENSGYQVQIISRQKGHVSWDDPLALRNALEGAEMLVNLAGKSVNCRYTEKNKREIYNSRTMTTEALGFAVKACHQPPPLWINASTATIYRHAEDRPMTEADGEIGEGFSVDVAKAWEDSFFRYQLPHTRQAALRIAIVLGKGGGVTGPYRVLARAGLGGKQGSGKQMFSWIHVEDIYRIIRFIQKRPELSGVFNCAAPEAVQNRRFTAEVRKVLGCPIGLPASSWMLEAGAAVIRTETELLLKSRWVAPARLLESGFTFRYPRLAEALEDVFEA